MKTIGRFFVQVLVLILVVTTCVSFLALTMLQSTKKLVSTQTIVEMVKQADFKELMGDRIQNEINGILEKTGIPNEYIDYILENDELKEYMGTYIAEGVEYILYEKEPPVIAEQDLVTLFSNSFDQVVTELENHKIEVSTVLTKEQQQQIHEKIEEYVPEIVEKIPDVEAFIEEKLEGNKEVQEIKQQLEELKKLIANLEMVYDWIPLLSLSILFQIVLIGLLKWRRFHFFKWIALIFFANFVGLEILLQKVPQLVEQHYPAELNFVREFMNYCFTSIYQIWEQNKTICLVIAVIAMLLQITTFGIHLYKNRRQKDMERL